MDIGSQHVFAETHNGEVINDLDHLIWQVWTELEGQVSRARIRHVAMQVAAVFRDAPTTTHIPLWVRHLTREWLKEEIASCNQNAVNHVFGQAHPGAVPPHESIFMVIIRHHGPDIASWSMRSGCARL